MQASENPKVKARKSTARRIVKWTAVAGLVLLVLVVVVVPMVVSSGGFRKYVLAKVNDSVSGQADFADLSMGWIKGVKVEDISFDDDAGQVSVKVKRIATKPHYASLLAGNLSFGQTTIDEPRVAISMKDKPPGVDPPAPQPAPVPVEAAGIAFVTDVVINDGSVRVTDSQGRTAELSKINSKIGLRLPGKESTFDMDMVLVAKGNESQIHTDASITPVKPKKGKGWTLEGATGQLTVEVSELDLESLEPFLALTGAEVTAKGRLSADLKSEIKDGALGNVVGKLRGSNLDIAASQLKGDRIRTKVLDADVEVTQKDKMISIDKLNLKTDFADLEASGVMPTTLKSLDSLLAPDSTSALKGSFNCDLAAVASQMPNTLGLKEGTNITSGRIVGNVETVAGAGKKQIKANADVVDLKGIVDGKNVALSEPVMAQALISKDKAGMTFDELNVSASFAKIDCTGTTEKLKYSAGLDLGKFQSELGQFVDLGGYRLAGLMAETGEVTIGEDMITVNGAAQVKDLNITSPNDVTVTEPKAEFKFAFDVDKKAKVVAINTIKADATFGQVNVADAVVPFGKEATKPMDLTVKAANIDLAKLQPFAVMFGSFPEDMRMSGILESEVAVTSKDDTYKIVTDKSKIKDFTLAVPEKTPFKQPEIALLADVELNTAKKTYTVRKFNLESDEIKVSFAPARLTTEGGTSTLVGQADLEYDWDAVGRAAAGYMPANLELHGKRTTSIKFASQYPASDPNKLLANLSTSKCTFGFDQVDYRGLRVGPADVNAQFDKGLLTIDPFTATANEGEITFGANADFRGVSPVISIAEPISIKDLHIDETLSHEFRGVFAYLNPMFNDVLGVSGRLNLNAEKLLVPLDSKRRNDIDILAAVGMDNLTIKPTQSGSLFSVIFPLIGLSGDRALATVHPTNFTVKDGFVRYDDMQVDVGGTAIHFQGAVGLDKRLAMQVKLPIGGRAVSLPLAGTIDKPTLDKGKLQENLLKDALKGLLDKEGETFSMDCSNR